MIRIVVADDEHLIREALVALLELTGDIEVVGQAASGDEALALALRDPLLRLSLFHMRTFRVSVLGGFITRLGIGGLPFLLPPLYQIRMGRPAG